MSTNGIKVYLDFNIYEHLICKGIPAEVLKVKDLHYFLSVAHAEELFNMAKNDVNNQYEENIKRKKQIMLELSDCGVLNPSINKGVELRQEALDDALERVRKNDTTGIVADHGKHGRNYFKSKTDKLREEDKNAINYSNLSSHDIWNIDAVQERIRAFDDNKKLYYTITTEQLRQVYGNRAAGLAQPITSTLNKGCYPQIKDKYNDFEYIIEYLFNTLEGCGYCSNKDIRTSVSGIYDTAHSIYASYCDILVSNDKRFRKKADAVYYYLGIQTKVLSFDEFNTEYLKLQL